MSPAQEPEVQYQSPLVRSASRSSSASLSKEKAVDPEMQVTKEAASDAFVAARDPDDEPSLLDGLYARFRVPILFALALTILAWWICSTVLQATRHRWCAFSASADAV